jgi:hypothetical protein
MTFIIIANAILAVAVVSAIVAGHLWAIRGSRPATQPAWAPLAPAPEFTAGLAPAMA